jgi:hypothetical protein
MKLTLTTKAAGHPRLLLLISSFCCADNVYFSLFHLPLVEPAYFYNILKALTYQKSTHLFQNHYYWSLWYNFKSPKT